MSCFCHHPDHLHKRRKMVIVFVFQKKILPVHSQGILGQVIGSETQKIHTFSQFFTDHNCSRCFDHESGTDIFVGNILLIQAFFYLLDQFFDLIQFFLRCDHRIHQTDVSIGTCPVNGTKLGFEHFFPVKAKSDTAVSHHRIDFIRDGHIFCLPICTHIYGTDHNRTAFHILRYLLISTEQFVLSWIIFSSKILEFTAQKTNPGSSVIQHTVQVVHISDIGIDFNFSAIFCDIRFSP